MVIKSSTAPRLLYVFFIRPLLEITVPVWSPAFKCNIDLLERVQHRATRLIPSLKAQTSGKLYF